jgi:hypothetical protein
MVYENLEMETRRHVLKIAQAHERKQWRIADGADRSITLGRRSLPVAILATCRQIQYEAIEYLRSRLRDLEQEPVCFILGYGGTAVLSDHYGPLAECFNDRVSPSLNPYIREITNRYSSFLQYTHALAFEPHVEFIVTRRSAIVYEGEFPKAMRGAWSIGSMNNLAVKVTYQKRFPRTMRWDYLQSGRSMEQYVRRRHVPRHVDFPDGPTFELNAVANDEDWANLLNSEE